MPKSKKRKNAKSKNKHLAQDSWIDKLGKSQIEHNLRGRSRHGELPGRGGRINFKIK